MEGACASGTPGASWNASGSRADAKQSSGCCNAHLLLSICSTSLAAGFWSTTHSTGARVLPVACPTPQCLCPGLPGSTALQLGSTMLPNAACSQQVLPSGLVKMITPNALESASQLTMSNYQTQNHAASNIFLLTKPFPSKTSITMKFSVTLWLMLKLLGISLSAMVALVSCGFQFPRTASPWNTKGSLPCSLSLQCSCIPLGLGFRV